MNTFPTPHLSAKVNVPLVVAVWVTEPEVPSDPDQGAPLAPPPLAVQKVAAVEDQVKVKEPPLFTVVGLAVKVAVSTSIFRVACATGPSGSDTSTLWQLMENVYCPAGSPAP